MKFFKYIENEKELFYKAPAEFNLYSDKKTLSYSLGATLYMDSLRKNLLKDIEKTTATSVVICLEDAISSDKVEIAEINVMRFLEQLNTLIAINPDSINNFPLIFLRIRSFPQFKSFLYNSNLSNIIGFVFPKFDIETGIAYFEELRSFNNNNSKKLYGMPIIETKSVIHKETRTNELIKIIASLEAFKDLVLNIRIGGTDFSGIYGLRRDKFHTIYDLSIINDCITDIINLFKIEDYVISAPVNEYFRFDERFENYGLYKELLLDKMNGLTGKTVIHPKQVDIVNALMVISKEDYLDARSILASSDDGVIRSLYNNKMNEVKPHTKWARHIMELSRIIGVFNNGKSYKDLLSLSNSDSSSEPFENIIDY